MKKNKTKKTKEKKILGVPTNLNFGEKIKNISINHNKLKIANLIWLILLNVALIATMVYYLVIAYNPWILVIAIFTVVICMVWSMLTYRVSVVNIKYTLYKNVIVKDYDTSKNVGEFAKLNGIKIKQTLLDKIGKQRTTTLVLHFSNKWDSKISLQCISENINDLTRLISELTKIAREKAPIKKVVEKTLIENMLENAPEQSKLAKQTKSQKKN